MHKVVGDHQSKHQELPDLDAAARDFYKEVRALSMDTGGSMADILENIGASSESLSSLIPHEKREVIRIYKIKLTEFPSTPGTGWV